MNSSHTRGREDEFGNGMAVASQESRDLAESLAKRSKRATSAPMRVSFVRDAERQGRAPMARLIARGGRGGGVPVKLFLALVWASVADPYDTAVSGRMWASLLDLPNPGTSGARRISEALRALQAERLIHTVPEPGSPPRVYLHDEGGHFIDYVLPATAWARAKTEDKPRHAYFKVPVTLWTEGHIQPMSASALSMLLVCLSNPGAVEGKPVWWSTRIFPELYGISPATRARGTRELVERGLLQVTKTLVTDSPQHLTFSRQKVRNIYRLVGAATLPGSQPDATPEQPPTDEAKDDLPPSPPDNSWPPEKHRRRPPRRASEWTFET